MPTGAFILCRDRTALIALLLPNGLSNRRNVINYLDLMHNYIRSHSTLAFPVNPDRRIMPLHAYLCKAMQWAKGSHECR